MRSEEISAGVATAAGTSNSHAWHCYLFYASALILALTCYYGGSLGLLGKSASRFIFLYLLTALAALLLFLAFPEKWSANKRALIILLLALLVRVLLAPQPASDDVNRYLWEGRVILSGFSPYAEAPDSGRLQGLRDEKIWPAINHPEKSACYPPLILLLFSLCSWILYSPLSIKVMLVFFDLLAVVSLLGLLRQRGLSDRYVFIYAFNPVVLYSFAGQGHLDAVHVGLFSLALWLGQKKYWRLMFLALGLAVQAKYIAVLALPFMGTRDNFKHIWLFCAAAFLPFLVAALADGGAVFASIFHFTTKMAFAGSVHHLLRQLFAGNIERATLVCSVIFVLVYGWGLRKTGKEKQSDPAAGLLLCFGSLLIFAPTFHFWYLTWIIPLLVLRPQVSWLVLSLSVCSYFAVLGRQHYFGVWQISTSELLFMWLPFYVLFLFELPVKWQRWQLSSFAKPESLSVIVPTLNEEKHLPDCLDAIKRAERNCEIIVVDAGSKDATCALAETFGARVIQHNLPLAAGGGRGGQLKAGVEAASGDVVVLLHADILVKSETFTGIFKALANNPDAVGGAVGSSFAGNGIVPRLLEFANNWRAGILAISFGDQVQFFRRSVLTFADAVPDIPLMEDVELSFVLKRFGLILFLWGDCPVSVRHWQKNSVARILRILRLVFHYCLLRVFTKPDTVTMYRKYYGS